jgi:hypothetical protein
MNAVSVLHFSNFFKCLCNIEIIAGFPEADIEGCKQCVSSEVKMDIRAKFNLKISLLHTFFKGG